MRLLIRTPTYPLIAGGLGIVLVTMISQGSSTGRYSR